ncbi:MAG: CBS domain-containing protein [Paracoccaceae bacterium]
MLVQQIMNGKPVHGVATIEPGATLADVARMLSEKRIGALIVSRDGKSVNGIISERDVVRELGKRGVGCLTDKVDAVMTRDVVGCTANDSADHVMEKMTAGRFRHMPVLEGKTMVGLISIGDVVKARLAELSMEKEALTGMIMGN